MNFCQRWIWLPEDRYPDKQTTVYSAFCDEPGNFTVCEFKKKYTYEKKIASATLRFSADTQFQLFLDGKILATGPAWPGGDFIFNEKPRDDFYLTEAIVYPESNKLDFFARVKMTPTRICEFSKGVGGFTLTGLITFDDGTKTEIFTDESWLVRYNGCYKAINEYDSRIGEDEYVPAFERHNVHHCAVAPIPPLSEENIPFDFTLQPEEEKNITLELDMIYAGYFKASASGDGTVYVDASLYERIGDDGIKESCVFKNNGEYRGFNLHSAGFISLKFKNDSHTQSKVTVTFIKSHYPVFSQSKTVCSDEEINAVLDVCAHTLKYCRQNHHLDSPKHCEPLACTGDYYIESLMTAMSFGDMRLCEFDVLRTAELLRSHDGRLFHTTYSLIWVRMLYDVYLITGNIELLKKCEDALIMLLDRFTTYIGENGIIDNPPDYMFVDWIYIDEISMHHPPKALGQTCLNMFYYSALDYGEKIFNSLNETPMAEVCRKRKTELQKNVNALLFDKEKGLYFEGLNTPTPEDMLYHYMPQNVSKRYYLKQSNILAAYVGICDKETAVSLIDKIMTDECPGDYQPYFAHYFLEAIYKNGLRDKYTLKVIDRWKAPVKECPKGLVEGFIAPEPTYSFDHSHAWGGTPLYSLPKALTGIEINKPGYKEVTLSPSLLGLHNAKIEIPTPYGQIVCKMEENKAPEITFPEEIKVSII